MITAAPPARPWLSQYGKTPTTLTPAFAHALAMFQATVTRDPAAPLICYFNTALDAGTIDNESDALASALLEAGLQ
jgi:hypothetical protein